MEENREITIGFTMKSVSSWSPTASAGGGFALSAHVLQRQPNESSMKKVSELKDSDDLRQEYDLSQLKGGVRGKYYRRATAGTNLVLIEPDLASVFPDADAVNRALRVLADAAQAARKPRRQRSRSK